jgi:hypothetical protein
VIFPIRFSPIWPGKTIKPRFRSSEKLFSATNVRSRYCNPIQTRLTTLDLIRPYGQSVHRSTAPRSWAFGTIPGPASSHATPVADGDDDRHAKHRAKCRCLHGEFPHLPAGLLHFYRIWLTSLLPPAPFPMTAAPTSPVEMQLLAALAAAGKPAGLLWLHIVPVRAHAALRIAVNNGSIHASITVMDAHSVLPQLGFPVKSFCGPCSKARGRRQGCAHACDRDAGGCQNCRALGTK